ncbi:NACHT domain-containing protein [Saccharicrinis sp. GN24d3]|uniref:NACHT domain-containing protein n=1 Tax=Saccharicrinis sp. GN24d3 TaxID=3458416 RepID=UPI004035BF42
MLIETILTGETLKSFITGLLVSFVTDGGKKLLKKLSGDNTMSDKIEKAYEEAVRKWTKNESTRKSELIHLSNRKEQLVQVILRKSLDKEVDNNIKLLLDLFKEELMKSNAYYLLIDCYFEHFVSENIILNKKVDSLINAQEQLKAIVIDAIKELRLKSPENFLPLSETTSKTSTNRKAPGCFLKQIDGAEVYIPRSATDQKELNNISINTEGKQRITLQDIIKVESRIVLLGSAGMGKSIELKETAIALVKSGEYYPIFISLNTYTSEDSIEDILPDHWTEVPQDQIVLFLDGFDEIEPSELNKAKRRIASFSKKHKEIKIVLSCRTNFYDLSINTGEGTIRGYKEFFLQELSVKDVKDFVDQRYPFNGEEFIYTIYSNKLEDIAFNPFFLQLILKKYDPNVPKQQLKRTDLFRDFIESRFSWDSVHFEETMELRDEKYKALSLLRKISLAMETAGVRVIEEKDLRELISETNEFKLIKYCTVFTKDEATGNRWKFEHNYFQEFLCAELLSQQDFETVKSFISHKKLDKVLPTWFNTVAQLISILNSEGILFKKLINWLVQNDSEVLVNVEREKLSPSIRKEIFKQIFEYYRGKKIWIDSNKFNDTNLAYFGQSNESIDYILSIAMDCDEPRINRMNALYVMRGFTLDEYPSISTIKENLLSLLEEKINDHNFAYSVIRTITNFKFRDRTFEYKIFELVKHKKSRNIRAAMYSYLAEGVDFEKHVKYFLEGYTLLKKGHPERGHVRLIDEDLSLKRGIMLFKSPKALKNIIAYCIEHNFLEHSSDSKELYESIISNCVDAFNQDQSIYHDVFQFMKHHSKRYHSLQFSIVLSFFTQTGTRDMAFYSVLDSFNEGEGKYTSYIQLAGLITEADFVTVLTKKLGDDFINRLYWDIYNINVDLAESFKVKVKELSGYEIPITERIDWDSVNRQRVQDSFNLLFDFSAFQIEVLRVFGDKNVLTEDELWEVRRNNRRVDLEELYVGSALDFIREFTTPVEKTEVKSWFPKNEGAYENMVIGELYQYIKNHKNLEVEKYQIAFIKNWYDKNIETVDFTKAITHNEDGSFTINDYSCYLTFFMCKFSFNCKTNILLDMLSFTLGDTIGLETISLDYIVENIEDKSLVDSRIIDNLTKHTLDDFSTYKAHVEYALINNLETCYGTIVEDLVTMEGKYYQKNNIVDLLIKSNIDISLLENCSSRLEINLRLYLLRKLLTLNKKEFVINHLLEIDSTSYNIDVQCEINKLLISTGQIEGLIRSINWIKKTNRNPFSQNGQSLTYYKDIAVLPQFKELLELSYNENIKCDHEFDNLLRFVVGGLEELALVSQYNFEVVIGCLEDFITTNKETFKNVEFLNMSIEVIRRKYYEKLVVKHDMLSAKEKINALINE